MPKRLYIDMDGTLARFHDVKKQYVEAMWEQSFYANLKPFEGLTEAIRLFMSRNEEVEVYILSAVLDTEPPFVAAEKREWLQRWLPEIREANMIFVPAGENKGDYVQADGNTWLIDDYNKNLHDFEDAGGHAIKFRNDVNQRGLGAYGGERGNLWQGDIIHYDDTPGLICEDIERVLDGQRILSAADYQKAYWLNPSEIENLTKNLFTYCMHKNAEVYRQMDPADPRGVYMDSTLADYCAERYISPKLQDCLEVCYEQCCVDVTGNDTRGIIRHAGQLRDWLLASRQSGEWEEKGVAVHTLRHFFQQMQERELELSRLSSVIEQDKKIIYAAEKNLRFPAKMAEIINEMSRGRFHKNLAAFLTDQKEYLNDCYRQWRDLTGQEYPKLRYGKKVILFAEYKNQTNRHDLTR